MTVSWRALGRLLRPTQFLPDLGDACQRDSCLHRRLVALGEMGSLKRFGPDQRINGKSTGLPVGNLSRLAS